MRRRFRMENGGFDFGRTMKNGKLRIENGGGGVTDVTDVTDGVFISVTVGSLLLQGI